MGNAELSRLWNLSSDNHEVLVNAAHAPPALDEYLRPLDDRPGLLKEDKVCGSGEEERGERGERREEGGEGERGERGGRVERSTSTSGPLTTVQASSRTIRYASAGGEKRGKGEERGEERSNGRERREERGGREEERREGSKSTSSPLASSKTIRYARRDRGAREEGREGEREGERSKETKRCIWPSVSGF